LLERYPHYERLSIDEIIFQKHGLYGVDYAADEALYQKYLDEADTVYASRCRQLLEAGRDFILERSFYAKEDRDEFKALVEGHRSRWVLVYLKATSKEASWERIRRRAAQERDANSAFEIRREVFEMYWNGFEHPVGEGEVVFEVT
jgi:predicted kinase